MQSSHNYLSAITKYVLIQAALVGVFTGFVFGLVGEASRFAAADSIFSILALLIGIGFIGYLAFPIISSAYLTKNYREKWLSFSIFGIMGLFGSITSIFLLLQYDNYLAPPVHVTLALAVGVPAIGFVLAAPLIHFLGRLREFTKVNFHLLVVLVIILTAVPSAILVESSNDILVEKERHGRNTDASCIVIIKTQCSIQGDSGTVKAPDTCFSDGKRTDIFNSSPYSSQCGDGNSYCSPGNKEIIC